MISQYSVDPSLAKVSPRNPPALSINAIVKDEIEINKSKGTFFEKSVSLPLIPTRELQALEFEVSMIDPDAYPTWFVVLSPREERGVSGPHNIMQLRKLKNDAEINETSLAWQEGLKDWSQIRYLPHLKHKILQPPKVPLKKDGELSDPLPPIATSEEVKAVEKLSDYNLMQFCSKCGSHAVYHTPCIGEQHIPNFPRLEEGTPTPVASEVVSGFLWIANAGGGKKGPIRQLGTTLIINCTENLTTPQSSPPLFRCIQLPLKEYIAGQTNDSEFDIDSILDTFQTVYEYLEFEKLYPERWADLDQMVPKYQGPMDREGKPIRKLGLHAPTAKPLLLSSSSSSSSSTAPASSSVAVSVSTRPRSAEKSKQSLPAVRRPQSPSYTTEDVRKNQSSSPRRFDGHGLRPDSPGSPTDDPAAQTEAETKRKLHVRNVHALRRSLFNRKRLAELDNKTVEHPEKRKYGHAPIKRPPDRPSRVLIFSRLGTDRSAAVAAAYLIKLYGITVETAISIVRKNRKNLKISPPYLMALKKWEGMHVLGEKLCVDCVLAGGRNSNTLQQAGDSLAITSLSLEPKSLSSSPTRQKEHSALETTLAALLARYPPHNEDTVDRHVVAPVTDNDSVTVSDDYTLSTGVSGTTTGVRRRRNNVPPAEWFLHLAPCSLELPVNIPAAERVTSGGAEARGGGGGIVDASRLIRQGLSFASLVDLQLGGMMLGDEMISLIFKALATTSATSHPLSSTQAATSSSSSNSSSDSSSSGQLIRRLRSINISSNSLTCIGVSAICEALLGLEVNIPETNTRSTTSIAPSKVAALIEGEGGGGGGPGKEEEGEIALTIKREERNKEEEDDTRGTTNRSKREYTEKEFATFAKLDWELLSLDFSMNRIGVRGATDISTLLRYCPSVLSLSVVGNEMNDEACAALVASLKRPPEEFPVDQTDDTAKYAAYARPAKIAPAVVSKDSFNQSLTELNLGGNNLSTRGVAALTDALKENAVLHTLAIDYSPTISPKGFKELFNGLRSHNQGLNRLSLSDNSLSVKSFAYALRAYEGDDATLSWLAASRCSLTSRHIASLSRFSNTMHRLAYLDLSGNHIGDAGAEWIAKVLWGRFIKRNLEQRNLASDSDEEDEENEPQSGGGTKEQKDQQGEGVATQGGVPAPQGRGNKLKQKRMILDESDDEDLPANAPNYPPLRYLDMSTCSIEAAGAQAILQAATCRPELTYFDISDNNLGKNFFTSGVDGAPTEALKALSNCKFVTLKMNRNNLQPRGAVALFELFTKPGAVTTASGAAATTAGGGDGGGAAAGDGGGAAAGTRENNSRGARLVNSLNALYLADNVIKDSAAEALTALLKVNETLQMLDLGFNEFTDAVIGDVAKATEVTSSSTLRRRLIPLNVNLLGNKLSDPYALALPGRARAKNLFDLGVQAPERVGVSQMRAYDNVASHTLSDYLDRKAHYEKYLEETHTFRINSIS